MPQVVSAEFARDFMTRLHRSVNAHDAAAVAALCHKDVVWEDPAAPGFARTGGKLQFETAEFSHFEAGQLIRHTVVLNMLELARQIGAVPAQGTLAARMGVRMQHVAAYWARAMQR